MRPQSGLRIPIFHSTGFYSYVAQLIDTPQPGACHLAGPSHTSSTEAHISCLTSTWLQESARRNPAPTTSSLSSKFLPRAYCFGAFIETSADEGAQKILSIVGWGSEKSTTVLTSFVPAGSTHFSNITVWTIFSTIKPCNRKGVYKIHGVIITRGR
jgi:hypothetical protein